MELQAKLSPSMQTKGRLPIDKDKMQLLSAALPKILIKNQHLHSQGKGWLQTSLDNQRKLAINAEKLKLSYELFTKIKRLYQEISAESTARQHSLKVVNLTDPVELELHNRKIADSNLKINRIGQEILVARNEFKKNSLEISAISKSMIFRPVTPHKL